MQQALDLARTGGKDHTAAVARHETLVDLCENAEHVELGRKHGRLRDARSRLVDIGSEGLGEREALCAPFALVLCRGIGSDMLQRATECMRGVACSKRLIGHRISSAPRCACSRA